MKQALIVIDMQNGFLNPESPLCIRGARATVPACARVIAACRRAETPVIFVNRAYRADGSDVEHTRYQIWAEGGKPLTPGSTGPISIENPPEFGRCASDYEIVKPRYSAFFQTSLDLLLRRLKVDTVVLTGTTTPNCIRTTCYDAISLDYQVVVLEDCCSSNTEEIQRANMLDMKNVGTEIRSSSQFLRELSGLTVRPAKPEDLDRCAEVEAACFPPEQAASRASIRNRIAAYPESFLVGELNGVIVGYAMGPAIDAPTIADEMFADVSCHNPGNPYQSVFSLAVHPDFQCRGYGRILLDTLIGLARQDGRRAVVLTCRDVKLAYYQSFGFENQGVSASVHGGVVWYDMTLPL
ncbi:MAG: isochorismatase family protein [Oscillibacter sp.]|nr:isochorismatase family protein [Oscillibacter sp.]